MLESIRREGEVLASLAQAKLQMRGPEGAPSAWERPGQEAAPWRAEAQQRVEAAALPVLAEVALRQVLPRRDSRRIHKNAHWLPSVFHTQDNSVIRP